MWWVTPGYPSCIVFKWSLVTMSVNWRDIIVCVNKVRRWLSGRAPAPSARYGRWADIHLKAAPLVSLRSLAHYGIKHSLVQSHHDSRPVCPRGPAPRGPLPLERRWLPKLSSNVSHSTWHPSQWQPTFSQNFKTLFFFEWEFLLCCAGPCSQAPSNFPDQECHWNS